MHSNSKSKDRSTPTTAAGGRVSKVQRRQSSDGRMESQEPVTQITQPKRAWKPRLRSLEDEFAARSAAERDTLKESVSTPAKRSPGRTPQDVGDSMLNMTDSDGDFENSESDDSDEGVPSRPDGLSWEWSLSRNEKFSRLQTVERMMHCLHRRALKHEVSELREERRQSRRWSLTSGKGPLCSHEASPSAD